MHTTLLVEDLSSTFSNINCQKAELVEIVPADKLEQMVQRQQAINQLNREMAEDMADYRKSVSAKKFSQELTARGILPTEGKKYLAEAEVHQLIEKEIADNCTRTQLQTLARKNMCDAIALLEIGDTAVEVEAKIKQYRAELKAQQPPKEPPGSLEWEGEGKNRQMVIRAADSTGVQQFESVFMKLGISMPTLLGEAAILLEEKHNQSESEPEPEPEPENSLQRQKDLLFNRFAISLRNLYIEREKPDSPQKETGLRQCRLEADDAEENIRKFGQQIKMPPYWAQTNIERIEKREKESFYPTS